MNNQTWHRITVCGIVQGVGFRPFVYRIAHEMGLHGEVKNSPGGVIIHVQCTPGEVERFIARIRSEAPVASRVEDVRIEPAEARDAAGFRIVPSGNDHGITLISPDLATCDACLKEMLDPKDPRYRYAFINCTHCGPRYSIIRDIPYDRPLTTMQPFAMCDYCNSEYTDPLNRRFHAQPVACPECGPALQLISEDGDKIDGDPVEKTIELILEGRIVAIKGIGGFHLACDARNEHAVRRLRTMKQRPHKPFAVMALPEWAGNVAVIDEEADKLLRSTPAPIVILPKTDRCKLAVTVAPGYPNVALLFPYAPVHWLLLNDDNPCMVMTSANRKGEPIAKEEREIAGLYDACLTHDRAILNPCDDSVVRPYSSGTTLLRRSRGYIPEPLDIPFDIPPALAVGAELKAAFAIGSGRRVFLSPYLGNGASRGMERFFVETLENYKRWFRVVPEIVVCDRHPDYFSSRFARETGLPHIEVQHHHAHIAAVMAEHGLDESVIGVVYDGTGLGDDGTIWGGEIMLADYSQCERKFHLIPMPLPGGDASVLRPQRAAFAWLDGADDFGLSETERRVVERQIASGFNTPLSSGMGRLFDVASVLLGFREAITFEAQAAMQLENLCNNALLETEPYDYGIDSGVIDHRNMLHQIQVDAREGVAKNVIASRMHRTIVHWTLEAVKRVYVESSVRKIVLCGGVMQNRILMEGLTTELFSAGFDVYRSEKYPSNDGAIALGQIAIAGKAKR